MRKLLHTIVHISCRCRIGIAARNQRLDHTDDVLHCFGDAREHVGAVHVQRVHRGEIRIDVTVGDLFPRHTLAVCGIDDLVVHIGKVLNVTHAIAFACKIATNDIPCDKRARVANVWVVVRRHTAAVDADLALPERMKLLFLSRHCIIHSKHDRTPLLFLFKSVQSHFEHLNFLTHQLDALGDRVGEHIVVEVDIELGCDLFNALAFFQ